MKRLSSIVAVVLLAFVAGASIASWYSSSVMSDLRAPSENGIGIPALVERVRQELIAADLQQTANGASRLLVARSVDLEIAFVVKHARDMAGQMALEVVEANSKLAVGNERTHKMTIHLDVQKPEDVTISPTLK